MVSVLWLGVLGWLVEGVGMGGVLHFYGTLRWLHSSDSKTDGTGYAVLR
jgi:hypothetical protein